MATRARSQTIARRAAGTHAGLTMTGRVVGSCSACGAGLACEGMTADTTGDCPECGTRIRLHMVYGEKSGVPCDSTCMGAVGKSCSCSCGGANHGRYYVPVHLVPVWDAQTKRAARAAQTKRVREHAERAVVKADAKATREAAGRAQLLAEHPGLARLLGDAYAGVDGFLGDMRRALHDGAMTPRMVESTLRALDREEDRTRTKAERAAAQAAALASGVRVPAGRVTFTGTIVKAERRNEGFAWRPRSTVKVTVRHADGWAVWGTLPESYAPRQYNGEQYQAWLDGLRGQEVTLTAELAPKDGGDGLFGFMKRARAAEGAAEGSAPASTRTRVKAAEVAEVAEVAAPAAPAAQASGRSHAEAAAEAAVEVLEAFRERATRMHGANTMAWPQSVWERAEQLRVAWLQAEAAARGMTLAEWMGEDDTSAPEAEAEAVPDTITWAEMGEPVTVATLAPDAQAEAAEAFARAVDRTDGELDAAVLAYQQDPTAANHARVMAAGRVHTSAFHAEVTGGYQQRTHAIPAEAHAALAAAARAVMPARADALMGVLAAAEAGPTWGELVAEAAPAEAAPVLTWGELVAEAAA